MSLPSAASSPALPVLTRPLARPAGASATAVAAAFPAGADSRRHAHLLVRVGDEYFALPLDSVNEGLETPAVLAVPGATGHWLGFIDWRGRRIPLCDARSPLGREAGRPCAAALVIGSLVDDAEPPLALAVDELCDVRVLPASAMRPFAGRHDAHGVVRAVAWDDDTLVAVVSAPALRAAMLAAVSPPAVA